MTRIDHFRQHLEVGDRLVPREDIKAKPSKPAKVIDRLDRGSDVWLEILRDDGKSTIFLRLRAVVDQYNIENKPHIKSEKESEVEQPVEPDSIEDISRRLQDVEATMYELRKLVEQQAESNKSRMDEHEVKLHGRTDQLSLVSAGLLR